MGTSTTTTTTDTNDPVKKSSAVMNKTTSSINISYDVPLKSIDFSKASEVQAAKDKIKNALFASLQAVNPFGSSGKTIVDVTISKKKRKRRSAEAAVAHVAVQYSGAKQSGQVIDTTTLASKVSKSTQSSLSAPSFTTLVDQSSLKNVNPTVVMATTSTSISTTSSTTTTTTTKKTPSWTTKKKTIQVTS